MAKAQLFERFTDEPDRAWQNFVIYRGLEGVRSQSATSTVSGASRTDVYRWSKRFEWVKRCRAWDAEKDRQLRSAHLREVRDMEVRHVRLSNRMLQLAARDLERIIRLTESGTCGVPSIRSLTALVKAGAELERLAMGKPTEIVEYQESETDLSSLSMEDLKNLNNIRKKLVETPEGG